MQGGLAEHRGVVAGEAVGAVAVGAAAPFGQARGLDEGVGNVHPEAGDAAVQPEAQDPLEFLVHGVVVPVEVRLGGVEQVQVPLAGRAVRFGDPGPGWAAEVGLPVVRRLLAECSAAVAEDEHVPFRAAGGRGQGGLEGGCWSEQWLGTRSTIIRRPSRVASAIMASKSASVPNRGSTSQ